MHRGLLNNKLLNFVHITDCHLGDDVNTCINNINTYESFNSVCEHIQRNQQDLDFILITGDISQTGTAKSYELSQSILSKFNTPIYCLPGNHDDPSQLQDIFPDSPVEQISHRQLNGIFLLQINTTVKNEEYGCIKPDTLRELEYLLKQNINMPAIIAMHHPTISTNTPWMDKITLKDSENIHNYLLQHKNIKLVITGHTHMDIQLTSGNTMFISTPSTCYQFKKGETQFKYDTLNPGYRLITIDNKFNINTELFRITI